MKRNRMAIVLTALALIAVSGWMLLPTQNPYQISGALHDTIAQAPAVYANTPDTSSSFSMAGYIGAAIFAQSGVVDNAATPGYLVYQDSSGYATWANRDSVLVDTTDNASMKMHYVPLGAGAKIRTIFRGTALAADTAYLSVTLLRSCQTTPC